MRAHDGCAANIKLSVVEKVQMPAAYDFSGMCVCVCVSDNSCGFPFPQSLPEEKCIVGIL